MAHMGNIRLTRQPPQAPPSFIPPKPAVSYIIDCVHQYTYVWLRSGESFWFYPTMSIWRGLQGIDGADHTGISMVLIRDSLMPYRALRFLPFTEH